MTPIHHRKRTVWTENEKIKNIIRQARSEGLKVRQRVSVPDFERFLGGDEALNPPE